jgi:hypothetical protein
MIIGGRAADACPSKRDEAIAAWVKRILAVSQSIAIYRAAVRRRKVGVLSRVASCCAAGWDVISAASIWLHWKPFLKWLTMQEMLLLLKLKRGKREDANNKKPLVWCSTSVRSSGGLVWHEKEMPKSKLPSADNYNEGRKLGGLEKNECFASETLGRHRKEGKDEGAKPLTRFVASHTLHASLTRG